MSIYLMISVLYGSILFGSFCRSKVILFLLFQNLNSSAFYTFLGGSSAFGMYIDVLCLVYLGIVMCIFILIDFGKLFILYF